MDEAGFSSRTEHATTALAAAHDLTPDGLRRIAYDPWMPLFLHVVPSLAEACAAVPPGAMFMRRSSSCRGGSAMPM